MVTSIVILPGNIKFHQPIYWIYCSELLTFLNNIFLIVKGVEMNSGEANQFIDFYYRYLAQWWNWKFKDLFFLGHVTWYSANIVMVAEVP